MVSDICKLFVAFHFSCQIRKTSSAPTASPSTRRSTCSASPSCRPLSPTRIPFHCLRVRNLYLRAQNAHRLRAPLVCRPGVPRPVVCQWYCSALKTMTVQQTVTTTISIQNLNFLQQPCVRMVCTFDCFVAMLVLL